MFAKVNKYLLLQNFLIFFYLELSKYLDIYY